MARIKNDVEEAREIEEGNLACLGNAIVLLDLVDERMAVAMQISRQGALLEPARGDLAGSGRCFATCRLSLQAARNQEFSRKKIHKVHSFIAQAYPGHTCAKISLDDLICRLKTVREMIFFCELDRAGVGRRRLAERDYRRGTRTYKTIGRAAASLERDPPFQNPMGGCQKRTSPIDLTEKITKIQTLSRRTYFGIKD